MKTLQFLLFFLLLTFTTFAQNKASDIVGIWLTNGDNPANVQIFQKGNKFFGKILSISKPTTNGRPTLDTKNPDAALRSQPIVGLLLLKEFVFDGKETWQGGTIYDPNNGKKYDCNLNLKDASTLKVRGYVGISLLGRTEIWKKIQ